MRFSYRDHMDRLDFSYIVLSVELSLIFLQCMYSDLKYFTTIVENVGTVLPRDNSVWHVTVHSHLFSFAQLVPHVNRLCLAQYFQCRITVPRVEIFLPFLIVNRIEDRRWEYCEAATTIGRHISHL